MESESDLSIDLVLVRLWLDMNTYGPVGSGPYIARPVCDTSQSPIAI